ncbi:MAG: hypothetical protein ACREAA_14485 [Candidatus Polarisedimenticolia bacterium]
MAKVVAGGLAGGVVLLIWRALFHAVVPEAALCGAGVPPVWDLPARPLLRELLGDVGAAMIAAWVLSRVPSGRRGRVWMAAALGLLAWFTQGFPLWNWHGATAGFVLAEGIRQVTGWALAGGAIDAVMRLTDKGGPA